MPAPAPAPAATAQSGTHEMPSPAKAAAAAAALAARSATTRPRSRVRATASANPAVVAAAAPAAANPAGAKEVIADAARLLEMGSAMARTVRYDRATRRASRGGAVREILKAHRSAIEQQALDGA